MANEPISGEPGAMAEPSTDEGNDGSSLFDLAVLLAEHRKLLLLGPLLAALAALAATFAVAPTFTSRIVFLPPQQQQSASVSALASLGALAGLAGGTAGFKTPADQYAALLQSRTVADHLIDRFKLTQVYDVTYRVDARRDLARNVRVSVGKKDGLITVEVDDEDRQRAADMANQHVEELRALTSQLALTEAQQRRAFFEAQLKQTRDRLTQAQQALQASGFNAGALKAEPRAAAEGYAKLKAEATSAEVRLQALRRSLADDTPEVQQQQAALAALRSMLAKAEEASVTTGGPDYIGKYREFKYQEALFELFARQYEVARLDESRDGSLIQVVDSAMPAERKSKPKRGLIALVTAGLTFLLLTAFVVARHRWLNAALDPHTAQKQALLRAAFRKG